MLRMNRKARILHRDFYFRSFVNTFFGTFEETPPRSTLRVLFKLSTFKANHL